MLEGKESTQKIRDVLSEVNFQDMMSATPEEQQKFGENMQKKIADASKGLDDKVGTILNATQSKRLHELLLQRLGAAALVLPETVKALGLSTDQVTKINGVISSAASGFAMPTMPTYDPNQSPEDFQAAMRKAMQQMGTKMQEQTAKMQKDALAVLTDDQSIAWANLCGKPFTFPANAGFGGFGGGGFGGGGGPGGG